MDGGGRAGGGGGDGRGGKNSRVSSIVIASHDTRLNAQTGIGKESCARHTSIPHAVLGLERARLKTKRLSCIGSSPEVLYSPTLFSPTLYHSHISSLSVFISPSPPLSFSFSLHSLIIIFPYSHSILLHIRIFNLFQSQPL